MSSLAVVENVTTGKEVKLASEQPYHALEKFVPLDKSKAGKDSSWVQPYHAPVKLVPESKSVARKEVREVQPCHA